MTLASSFYFLPFETIGVCQVCFVYETVAICGSAGKRQIKIEWGPDSGIEAKLSSVSI